MKGIGVYILACITALLIPATPCAYLIIALAEEDHHYRYLSLIPLAPVAVIWVFVFWKWHREDSQKGSLGK
jgi:hypothetical protein